MGNRVHDARIFFHKTIIRYLYPGLTNATHVVSSKIDKHVQLGFFFRI
ncbi:MAG: hypothetical protein ACD_65C00099G0004 [uncultured bacterium]|nr:MAG: hypothetical protein ACD_65C00099G0004 [uncultured bacterium]